MILITFGNPPNKYSTLKIVDFQTIKFQISK